MSSMLPAQKEVARACADWNTSVALILMACNQHHPPGSEGSDRPVAEGLASQLSQIVSERRFGLVTSKLVSLCDEHPAWNIDPTPLRNLEYEVDPLVPGEWHVSVDTIRKALRRAQDVIQRILNRCFGVPGRIRPQHAAQWDQATEERDRWIYEQWWDGTKFEEIKQQVKARSDWEPIETVQGVKDAGKAYVDRYGLPLPPPRRPGRPKREKPRRKS